MGKRNGRRVVGQKDGLFHSSEQLTIHHFVPPSTVLGSNNRSHLVEQVQVVLLNLSRPIYVFTETALPLAKFVDWLTQVR